ncbi:MAG TPA: SHOCT domain-containing protein [Gaiellaceae bacterium]|nr:SHOCT domain-containing protein [Gaiellaceae bacterium]
MPVAADYPFLDLFWTTIVIFAWVILFWMLIQVLSDVFRRHDISGWAKAAWTIFVILMPFLGVLVYLLTQSKGIAERRAGDARAAKADFDSYVQSVAGGPAVEIEKAHGLLASGAITQEEFEAIKRKALASG